MKRCITLISLGLCLAAPMLSQASDINPVIHVTNVHNGQYDTALAAITDTKFYGPYQFLVLKDAIETQGETKDIDGRAFRTSDGVFLQLLRKLMELKLLVFVTFLKSILTSAKLNLLMLSPDVSHKKILLLRRLKVNLIKLIPCQTILFFGD